MSNASDDDWAQHAYANSKRSFEVGVDAMRERLEQFRCERIGPHRLYHGDMREIVPLIGQVHSCVTDPPYHLTSINKRYSSAESMKTEHPIYKRHARGFMGQGWDGGDISFDPETWKLVYSALLPGGHLASFAGTRTYHRIASAIDDAGFEIRDMCSWIFGSGFPKSHDVSKGIDRNAPRMEMFAGFASHLSVRIKESGKTNMEIAVLFPSKTGGLTGCVSNWTLGYNVPTAEQWQTLQPLLGLSDEWLPLIQRVEAQRERIGKYSGDMGGLGGQRLGDTEGDITAPATEAAKQWEGWGSSLKPAFEPVCLARKPLIGTIAQNVLTHGTGAINVDGCRVAGDVPTTTQGASSRIYGGGSGLFSESLQQSTPSDLGRWPANVLHDSSLEVLECFAAEDRPAVRFFYSPKASAAEREEGLDNFPRKPGGMLSNTSGQHITRRDGGEPGPRANHHPTVKPVDLMAWLVRLITPPGGICLDPFMGSGSTGIAALRQGFNFVGIEQDETYFNIAVARIKAAYSKPDLFSQQEKPSRQNLTAGPPNAQTP